MDPLKNFYKKCEKSSKIFFYLNYFSYICDKEINQLNTQNTMETNQIIKLESYLDFIRSSEGCGFVAQSDLEMECVYSEIPFREAIKYLNKNYKHRKMEVQCLEETVWLISSSLSFADVKKWCSENLL